MTEKEAAMEPYVIVSADSHAGLPTEQYRPYLEARFHRAFDDFLAERAAGGDEGAGGGDVGLGT